MYTLLHNPKCSKSRQALSLLEASGHEFEVRDYEANPLTAIELQDLQRKLGSSPAQWMRWNEPEAAEYDVDAPEMVLIQALVDHPRLLQRPILIHGDKAVIGRPGPETLQVLL